MPVFRSYVLAHLPAWLLAVVAAWSLERVGLVGGWVAVTFAAVWVVKDLLMFPTMRRFYESHPVSEQMTGATGTALTDLSERGLVRVNGELWQACAASEVSKGTRIRVVTMRGLVLVVDPADQAPRRAARRPEHERVPRTEAPDRS